MTVRISPPCPGRSGIAPNRRDLLRHTANGFGFLALSALRADRAFAGTPAPGNSPQPHFRPRARNVIFCFMDGGVSHVDTFDPKPKLAEVDGTDAGKVNNPTSIG